MSRLQADGHSRHYIRLARARGIVRSVRQDWIATHDAEAELVAAARAGVVLTCVTLARRLGLWVLSGDVPHVAVAPHAAGRRPELLRVHWAEPVVPRHPDAVEDSLHNALALIATCRPHEDALTIWESALKQGLVTPAELERIELPSAAKRLLAEATPFADSGLETIFRSRLSWLRVRIVPQAWICGHRVDFLIGDRLAVQIDGGHHVGAQRESDIAHDAVLRLRGYTVIRVGYRQVIEDWASVQWLIMQAIGQRLHVAS